MLLVGYAAAIVYPTLPSLDALTDYKPKIPLRIYSTEGTLIGEFGEERRAVVKIADVPNRLEARRSSPPRTSASTSTVASTTSGCCAPCCTTSPPAAHRQGASTITMQVARNFFLTKEKTLTRKFNEALLAFKIEHSLTKDQILEIYINQIYLGQRAYGFASAAQVYFGKNLQRLESGVRLRCWRDCPRHHRAITRSSTCNAPRSASCMYLRRMRELELHQADAQFEEAATSR